MRRPAAHGRRALHAWLEALLSRRLQLSYVVQMADNFFNVHHIHVFMMQVEQVHLVAQFNAIIGAFLDHADMKAGGIGIDHAGAHAA